MTHRPGHWVQKGFYIWWHPLLLTVYCAAVCARFLQHFALSSVGQEPILYDHLGVLFPSAELRNPASSQGDKVSILTRKQCSPSSGGKKKEIAFFFFQHVKGCHYHHHRITRKPQRGSLQLPGPAEQGTWKVIYAPRLLRLLLSKHFKSQCFSHLIRLIIVIKRGENNNIPTPVLSSVGGWCTSLALTAVTASQHLTCSSFCPASWRAREAQEANPVCWCSHLGKKACRSV